MKIGIWLGADIIASSGGGGSYSNRFLHLVDEYVFSKPVEICYLSIVPQHRFKKEVYYISQLPAIFYRFARISKKIYNFLRRIDTYIIKKRGLFYVLSGTDVKIVYYFRQVECVDSNFPFIINNWDIGHRSAHAFPELVSNENFGSFEERDFFYTRILPKALMVICESQTGKKELIDYTGLGAHKIRIMPIFAGMVSSLQICEERIETVIAKMGLSSYHYFYYPAQFWPHKNHIGLIKAFAEFCETHKGYKLVLSGTDMGNMKYVKSKVQQYGLDEIVVILGFISEEEVYALYRKASCLVMASHFGPTNMPPIEAMELDCPVACSDIGGHREILGNNAAYFNSYDYQAICTAMKSIANNRDEYVKKIRKQREITWFSAENAMKSLNDILKEVVIIRENWE